MFGEVMFNNTLFHGDETARFLAHNPLELARKTYFHVGQVIAISLVHGGPAPKCLANPIVDYILYGLERVKVTAADVPDISIRQNCSR